MAKRFVVVRKDTDCAEAWLLKDTHMGRERICADKRTAYRFCRNLNFLERWVPFYIYDHTDA